MAAPPGGGAGRLSLRHGVRCEVSSEVSVEQVLLAVGENVGCENIVSASRMNKAVVVFLNDRELVRQLVEDGIRAPSKDVVRQICTDSFPAGAHGSQTLIDRTARALTVSSTEAMQVLTAFHLLSHHVVFHNFTAPEQIQSLFPSTFHSNLKNLITKIVLEQSVTWRNEALSSQISLPRLTDLEWRVDMKMASDSVSRMAVPTCILNMKIQDGGNVSSSKNESSVTVELSKETLDTMLDGLGRIRDQLSAVAGK